MKIDTVIMSCDTNPFYLDFWKPVSKVWFQYIGIKPLLILLSDNKQVDISTEYGNVEIIQPDKNIPINTQAQMARLWRCAQESSKVFLTSDIDMIPCSKQYFHSINNIDNNIFFNLNTNGSYLPICYQGGMGSTFAEILDINNITLSELCYREIQNAKSSAKQLHNLENNGGTNMQYWGLDEEFLQRKTLIFKDNTRIKNILRPGGFCARRIDRGNWQYDINQLISGFYNDCHSLRPYNQYKKEIDTIINILCKE